ncbi:hypothetical protein JVU11DRAFT_8353 [Chiua virens]|nr:hypothetical protein JVU11DRAFT_8353 [Chiua virens]
MSFKAHYEGAGSKEDIPLYEFTERIPPEIALELCVLSQPDFPLTASADLFYSPILPITTLFCNFYSPGFSSLRAVPDCWLRTT